MVSRGLLQKVHAVGDELDGSAEFVCDTGCKPICKRQFLRLQELVTVLEPDAGHARVDQGQLEQVIMNLAVNARDAMPGGGKLLLETSRVDVDEFYSRHHVGMKSGSYVLLAVSDTGVGMDEPTRARIFEPFFTTKEKEKGTGLGLFTAYGIVKQSGGNIWAYSEPGRKGS